VNKHILFIYFLLALNFGGLAATVRTLNATINTLYITTSNVSSLIDVDKHIVNVLEKK